MTKEMKIVRLSRFLRFIISLILCVTPFMYAGYWATDGYPFMEDWLLFEMLPAIQGWAVNPLNSLPPWIKLAGFFITMIPVCFSMLSLYFLTRILREYEQLQLFSYSSIQNIRKLGLTIMWAQMVHPIYLLFLSFALTINTQGKHLISTGFGTKQLELLGIGAMILLLSWIMDEGRELNEEII